MMNEIDDKTVKNATAGDKNAFRLIVLHYAQAVNRLAYRYTADASYAEDIAQETFIKAFQAIGRYQAQAKFSTWLLRITTNSAIDYLRKANRQMAQSLDEEGAQREITDHSMDTGDRLDLNRRLSDAMSDLSDVERLAITMKHHQGYSIDETAQVLNIKNNACKQTIFRAVQKLRKQLTTEVSA
ncbi:RNA polymerase sigma-70 factor (ECF subfamily) [Marinicella litoralis]|uniref:RNA polymerase sigma factor n=2 Tax=Marinicella litoralis TaxID=644220 RepID=A0A4R6Y411_9GAMM|nr:RNA polymerase sigma-70 factor (ECF subfamily) [Marinicella litoralis]